MKKMGFITGILLVLAAQIVCAQTRYALVIGNQNYQNIGRLANPANDAQDIAAALRGLGYQVDLKLNAKRIDMINAVDQYAAKLSSRADSEGFFWYAGHGIQLNGENYLLPVDVAVDSAQRVRSDSYALNDLLAMFKEARNKINIVVLDACRNNPLPNASRGAGTRGLAVVNAADVPQDLIVMYSTAAGDVAADGENGVRNSPFAAAFLKYITSPEPLTSVITDVTNETLTLTRRQQRPFQTVSITQKNYALNITVQNAIATQSGSAAQSGAVATRPAAGDPVTDFEYNTSSRGTVTITDYKGSAKNPAIPARINNLPVTSIGEWAFYSNQLTSVTIPDSVTSIGESAFSSNKLTSVTIGNSVTSIGEWAFYSNQLTSVTIPDSVTSIGKDAFSFNKLTSVTIGNSVTSIGEGAFRDSKLTSVTIGNSVTSIGEGAFRDSKLTSVTIPNSVTAIGKNAFMSNQLTSVTIGNSVISIGMWAFYDNQLTRVTIGDSVKTIGGAAFFENQLTSVTIPDSVTTIEDGIKVGNNSWCGAFARNQLTSVTIGSSVKTIGMFAFNSNQLTRVVIPGSVTALGNYAFARNRLTSVTIPYSVTTIGEGVFWKNQLTSVTIPNSVTAIKKAAFWENPLTSVTIGANVDVSEDPFPGNLADVYTKNRKRSGTYTSRNGGQTWRKP